MSDGMQVEVVGRRYSTLSPEDIYFFRENATAMQIYVFAMSADSDWVFSRKHMMDYLQIGVNRWRSAVKFLKHHGLMKTVTTRKKDGSICGRKMIFYTRTPDSQSNNSSNNSNIHRMVDFANFGRSKEYYQSGDTKGDRGQSTEPEADMTDTEKQEMRDKFLSRFPGKHTFQTFDDSKAKRGRLSKVLFKKNYELDNLNDSGAGIFFTVNECDGKGRKAENVQNVRAIFVDLDGSPVDPVLPYHPHIVVESSAGKFHAYWLVKDFPVEAFKPTQQHLAEMFDGDKHVNDLPRVMRVPGYLHRKGEPFLTRVIMESYHAPLSYRDVVEQFPPNPVKQFSAKRYQKKTEGDTEWKGPMGQVDGNRNVGLASFCGWMISRKYDRQRYEDKAFEWGKACTPVMSDHEIRGVVESVWRYR